MNNWTITVTKEIDFDQTVNSLISKGEELIKVQSEILEKEKEQIGLLNQIQDLNNYLDSLGE